MKYYKIYSGVFLMNLAINPYTILRLLTLLYFYLLAYSIYMPTGTR